MDGNLTEAELRVATPSPAFVVYDLHGNVVSSATPPVLPDGVHGCFVDRWDNGRRVQRFRVVGD